MNCSFTLDHFAEIIEKAKRSFTLLTFRRSGDRSKSTRPVIFLRHDVDHSLEDAVILAELERAKRVRATYFVQLHSPFYTVMSVRGQQCLQMIRAMGHEIGFHYDISYYRATGRPIVSSFRQDLALLSELGGEEIGSISRHDPSAEPLDAETQRQMNEAVPYNAYAEEFIKEIKYISDSTCHWRNGCCCQHLDEPADMQILIHPVWWVNDAPNWEDKLRQSCRCSMDRYTAMVENTIGYYQACLQSRAERDRRFHLHNLPGF